MNEFNKYYVLYFDRDIELVALDSLSMKIDWCIRYIYTSWRVNRLSLKDALIAHVMLYFTFDSLTSYLLKIY